MPVKSGYRKKSQPKKRPERGQAIAVSAGARPWLVCWLTPTLIALATVAVFLSSLQNGFVNWDDEKNLVDNPFYRGLGWAQLRWMFTTFHMGHYQPLSWVTFGLDYLLWGMNPFGYHLTSLLIHAANAVFSYFIAMRLISLAYTIPEGSGGWALWVAAGFAALFFSIHPLRVESVAWATERRDVLSGLFLLCTVLLYLRAAGVENRGSRRLWLGASVGVYVLSLLSKAVGITLPAVLLVLDVYPLRRLGGGKGKWVGREVRQIWWEKIPFLLVALGVGLVALLALKEGSEFASVEEHGVAARLAQSSFGLIFYVWKTVFPLDLSPIYELPKHLQWWSWPFMISGLVVLGSTLGLFLFRRRWPAGLAVWACYIAILLPVLGIAQNGPQIAADRYSYLPCLAWAVLAGAGIFFLWRGWTGGKISRSTFVGIAVSSLTVLAGLGVLASGQTRVWHDSERLWTYALSINEKSSFGHNNLGNALSAQGKLDEAVAHFWRGIEIAPEDVDLWYNLGNALARQGKLEEAITPLQRALQLKPRHSQAHYDLGNVRAAQGRPDEAAAHFRAALRIDPSYVKAHNNLGTILAAQGKLDEAMGQFREALSIAPDYAPAHENLARALAAKGKKEEALQHYREALRILKSQRQQAEGNRQ